MNIEDETDDVDDVEADCSVEEGTGEAVSLKNCCNILLSALCHINEPFENTFKNILNARLTR